MKKIKPAFKALDIRQQKTVSSERWETKWELMIAPAYGLGKVSKP